jgi:NDP-hexose-3-ketoreductase
MKFKLGIWGVGYHVKKNTLPALLLMKDKIDLVLYSRNIEMVKEIAGENNLEYKENEEDMLKDDTISAIYLSTPVGTHFEIGLKILGYNKHLWCEKSFCINLDQVHNLLELARVNNVSVFETFMYRFHNQSIKLKELLKENKLGKIRNYYTKFGFPHMDESNFRYNKDLGGGALFDAGAYCINSFLEFIDPNEISISSSLIYEDDYDIDIGGHATIIDENGVVGHLDWGFGRAYKNEVEIWGELGSLIAERFYSKPDTLETEIVINYQSGERENVLINKDNHFVNMFSYLLENYKNEEVVLEWKNRILKQAKVIDNIFLHSGNENKIIL